MSHRSDSPESTGLPQPRCELLTNGASVVLLKRPGSGVVAVQAWFSVGSADETENEIGLAHVHEHMLFKGTSRRPVGQIASEVESAGGDINAWTSYDQTVYHVVLPAEQLEHGLDILADAATDSAFDADELSRELEVILEEIKRSEDQPTSRLGKALFDLAFDRHPYRRPVIGFTETVSAFSRDDVVAFYRKHYRAERLTVVVVGDVDEERALQAVEKSFGQVEPGAQALPARPIEPRQSAPRARVLHDDINEAHVFVGFRGPSMLHPGIAALDGMTTLLGHGESSRLVSRVLREQRLVNDIHAYAYTPKDPGLVVLSFSTSPDDVCKALKAGVSEMRALWDDKVGDDELNKVKNLLASDLVYRRETAEGLARRLGYWSTLAGDPANEDAYQDQIARLSAEEIRQAARDWIRPETVNIACMLPNGAELKEAELIALVEETLGETHSESRRRSTKSVGGVSLHELSSGARLVLERDHSEPIVVARAVWMGGARSENDDTRGLSHLMAEVWPRGAGDFDAQALARRTDGLASGIDAFAGRNSLGLRTTFLKKTLDESLPLLETVLHAPRFDDDEVSLAKQLAAQDFKSRADHPAGLALEQFAKTLWDSHPYRYETLGDPDVVAASTSTGLRDLWLTRARPQDCVLAFAGDIDEETALSWAERLTSADDARPAPANNKHDVESALDEDRIVRLFRQRAQAHLVVGYRGLQLDDPQRRALDVLTTVLSGQGGRLFLELRDKQSLCYSVSCFSVEGIEPGSVAVYMGTSPEKVDQALVGIDGFLHQLTEEGISDKELDRARSYLIGTQAIGMQRRGSRSTSRALNELYGLGYRFHERFAEQIGAVTAEDVLDVARRLFSAKRVISLVGSNEMTGPEATMKVHLSGIDDT